METRNTRQRTAIRALFERSKRPLSIEEAHGALRRRLPRAGIATVYRTVSNMVADGSLESVVLPGEPVRYERGGKQHHHHFQCDRCQRVFDLEGCVSGVQTLVPPKFRLRDHSVALYGLCPRCA